MYAQRRIDWKFRPRKLLLGISQYNLTSPSAHMINFFFSTFVFQLQTTVFTLNQKFSILVRQPKNYNIGPPKTFFVTNPPLLCTSGSGSSDGLGFNSDFLTRRGIALYTIWMQVYYLKIFNSHTGLYQT